MKKKMGILILWLGMISTPFAAFAQTQTQIPWSSLNTIGFLESQEGADIQIKESSPNAWIQEQLFTLTLPDGIEWNPLTKVNGKKIQAKQISGSTLTIDLMPSDQWDQLMIQPVMDVTKGAGSGEVRLLIQGKSIDNGYQELVIARVNDYGLALKQNAIERIPMGSPRLQHATIQIEELVEDTLIKNQFYKIHLEGAIFDSNRKPTITQSLGKKQIELKAIDDQNLVLYGEANQDRVILDMDFYYELDPNEKEEVTLSVTGRDTDEQTVIASVKDRYGFESTGTKKVWLGKMNQSVTGFSLHENMSGGLLRGTYQISLEPTYDGVDFSSAKVKVVSGDLQVKQAEITPNGLVRFEVQRLSSLPSTIEFYDLLVNLDRFAYEGSYEAVITYLDDRTEAKEILRIPLIEAVLNPKEVGTVQQKFVSFVIGQKDYSIQVNGAEAVKSFDVAPFIFQGRAMLSVKAAAEALNRQVAWDPINKQVIISSTDGQLITLEIGSRQAIVNGKKEQMELAPIIEDGRTFVPISQVGNLLGVQIQWDDSKRQVTIVQVE